MLILGLLIILGSAALTVGIVYDGGEAATVEVLGTSVDTTVAGVFFTGAGTMLLFLIGVWLLTSSMGRARRKRGERKESRRRQKESVAKLEAERTKLRAENERLSEALGGQPGTGGATVGDADSTLTTDSTDTGGAHARTDDDARSDSDLRAAEAARSTRGEQT
jgi:hypothetical protein